MPHDIGGFVKTICGSTEPTPTLRLSAVALAWRKKSKRLSFISMRAAKSHCISCKLAQSVSFSMEPPEPLQEMASLHGTFSKVLAEAGRAIRKSHVMVAVPSNAGCLV